MVNRGLILPPHLLDIYVQPMVEQPVGGDPVPVRTGVTLGALWGIAPEFHADFQLTPFYLPQLGGGTGKITFAGRVLKTRPVDLGLNVVTMFDPSAEHVVGYVQPGMAVIYRTGGPLRLDSGLQLPLYTNKDPHWGFRVPVSVYLQISKRVHIGSTSSLFLGDLRDPWKTASIPFGLTAGYSAGAELDFAAFTPYISWTNFYTPSNGHIDTHSFVAGIIADVAIQIP